MKRTELRLPDDLHAWLAQVAARARIEGSRESQNDIIIEALRRERERREGNAERK